MKFGGQIIKKIQKNDRNKPEIRGNSLESHEKNVAISYGGLW